MKKIALFLFYCSVQSFSFKTFLANFIPFSPFVEKEWFSQEAYHDDYFYAYSTFFYHTLCKKEEIKTAVNTFLVQEKENLSNNHTTSSIPKVIHTVHSVLEGDSTPEMCPEKLMTFLEDLACIPKEYRVIFWCNDLARIPQTLKALEKSPVPIEVRSLDSLEEAFVSLPLYRHALTHGLKKKANYLAAMAIIYHHGGVYLSSSVRFDPKLFPLLAHFNHVFAGGRKGLMEQFFASAPGLSLFKDLLITLPKKLDTLESRLRISLRDVKQELELFLGKGMVTRFVLGSLHKEWKNFAVIRPRHNGITFTLKKKHKQRKFLSYPIPPSIYSLYGSLFKKPITYSSEETLYRFDPLLFARYFPSHKKLTEKEWVDLPKGVTDTPRTIPIIVSLTSWPPRTPHVWLAIESIMQGTLKPDRIILFLAEEEFPTGELPWTLEQLKKRGLEVRFCSNLFGGKKLIPLKKEHETSIIVTIDDDMWYKKDFLKNLYATHCQKPSSIIGNKGIIFTQQFFYLNRCGDGIIFPKDSSHLIFPKEKKGIFVLPFGGWGILYPPLSLHKEAFNEEKYLELCAKNDDVWFSAMGILNNKTLHLKGRDDTRPIFSYRNVASSLFVNYNVFNMTDYDLNRVFKAYNLYTKLGLKGMASFDKDNEVFQRQKS